MKIAYFYASLLCAAAASVIYYYACFLPEQDKQREKREQAKTNLELQEKCAKRAHEEELSDEEWTRRLGIPDTINTTYVNHYNGKLNKCFMTVEITGALVTAKYLSDAFEEKKYGYYRDRPVPTAPTGYAVYLCNVAQPLGEDTQCKSLHEFENLIKYYME